MIHNDYQTKDDSNKYLIAIIALLIIPLSGVSIDIYVPSLPAITSFFNVNKELIQLTITIYMIGFGGMQLISGSITDSIGRKKPFLVSMIVYILATFLIPYSFNIFCLLFLRLIQGMAVGCFNVPMRAIISDLFKGKEFNIMINYLTIAWAAGPIIAPAIGGYLQYYLGWKAVFYFLSGYGAIMLMLNLIFVPETLVEKKEFYISKIINDYRELLFNSDYLFGLLCLGILYLMLVLFSMVVSFFVINTLHYSSIEFGYIAFFMGLAWFLGNITNRFLINVNIVKKIRGCFTLMGLDAFILLMLTSTYNKVNNVFYIINVLIFIFLYLASIVYPNYYAKTISLFSKFAGTANSLMGAFMILIVAIGSGLGTLLKTNTLLPLAIVYILLTVVCLCISYFQDWFKEKLSVEIYSNFK